MAPVDPSTNRPNPEIRIKDVTVFVDPFEEFLNKKREEEEAEKAKAAGLATGDDEFQQKIDDEHITWTGKRVRGYGSGPAGDDSGGGVGKYLKAALADRAAQGEDEIVEFVDEEPEPEHVRKKMKSAGCGGFGNFDSW